MQYCALERENLDRDVQRSGTGYQSGNDADPSSREMTLRLDECCGDITPINRPVANALPSVRLARNVLRRAKKYPKCYVTGTRPLGVVHYPFFYEG